MSNKKQCCNSVTVCDDGEKIPEKWKLVKIEECCDILDSKRIPLNSQERKGKQGDIPYYGANGVQDYINQHIFDEDLILLAEDGGNFFEYQTKPIAYMIHGKSWVNNHAHILKNKPNYDLSFIFYSLVHKNMIPWINGTTRSKLNQSELREIEIPTPRLNIQQKISLLLTDVDYLISNIQTEIHQTQALRKEITQQLLSKGIDHKKFKKATGLFDKEIEIPERWMIKNFDQLILKSKNGFTGKPNDNGNGMPRLGISSISNSDTLYVKDEIHRFIEIQKSKRVDYLVQKNDLLVCRQNGNLDLVGKTRFVNKTKQPMIFSDSLILLKIRLDEVMAEFIVLFLEQEIGRKQITRSCTTTAGNYSINGANLKKINILYPPLSEQKKIVSIVSSIDEQIHNEKRYNQHLLRLKKGLMQKLLTGKIRVPLS